MDVPLVLTIKGKLLIGPIDLHSSRQLEIHFETAIEAAKINHLPVLQFERWV
jgi:hypothetical protein